MGDPVSFDPNRAPDRLDFSAASVSLPSLRVVAPDVPGLNEVALPPARSGIMLTRQEQICDIQWARELRDSRLVRWTERLHDNGLPGAVIVPRGSVENGHYTGPKERSTTYNACAPIEQFSHFVEIDLRIVVPEDVNPQSDQVRVAVTKTFTEGKLADGKLECFGELLWGHTESEANEWQDRPRCHYYYAYEPLVRLDVGSIALEWEIGVYSEPIAPVDPYWGSIFTPEEVAHQTEIRTALKRGGADYHTTIWRTKDAQCYDAVWRVVAGYGLRHLAESGAHLPALDEALDSMPQVFFERDPHPRIVAPRAREWASGMNGSRIWQRPDPFFPIPETAAVTVAEVAPGLLRPPAPPAWVAGAVAVRRHLLTA